MKDVVAINCTVKDDGTVIPDEGFGGNPTSDGPFHGDCEFRYYPARGKTKAMIICETEDEEAVLPPSVPALPAWVPVIDGISLAPIIGWGALPSLAHPSQVVYDISAEPGFPELYDPTYGWGHVYWLVVDIDGGAPIFDGAVLAGDHGVVSPVNVDYIENETITTRARLYSASGGTLLHTLTFDLTPTP